MTSGLVLSLIVFVCCQSNVWNGIVPLKSTRADVEKLLGLPPQDNKGKDAAIYKTKDGKVFVLYSTGPCKIKPSRGWNVPESTVISVSVYPDAGPKFAELKLDIRKFEKRPDPEALNEIHYLDEIDGIGLTVDTAADGEVTRFSYFPESKYNYLRCK